MRDLPTPSQLGLPAAIGILLLMDAGVPIPIPTDLLLLAVGERAAAGAFPVWAAALGFELVAVVSTSVLFLALSGPVGVLISHAGPRFGLTAARVGWATALVERRGRAFLAVGRSTPGLRTLTVFTAATARLRPLYALPAMILGSTIFLQGHLLLGYFLGPLADQLFAHSGPLLIVIAIVALLLVGFTVWRRRRRLEGGGTVQAWTEACCPACLAVALLTPEAKAPRSP